MLIIRGNIKIKLEVTLDKLIVSGTFNHLLKLPYKFFEVRAAGDIIYRLNSLQAVRNLLSESIIKGLIDLGMLIIILGYITYKSVILSLVLLTLLAIISLLIVFYKPYISEVNQNEIIENGKLQALQVESVFSMMTIKTTGIEKDIYNGWLNQYKRVLDKYSKKEKMMNIYNSLITIWQIGSPFIVLFLGIYLSLKSIITIGEAISFYSLSSTFFSIGISIFQTYYSFILSSDYLERVRDITDTEVEEINEKAEDIKIEGDIVLDNISFSYTTHSEKVIKNLTMKIPKGKKVAIVGKSGSGKSTISKIILGLYKPNEGQVIIDKHNIEKLNKQKVRKQIGIVPQDVKLFNKSIYENIRGNNEKITIEDVKNVAEIVNLREDIESMPMGYQTLVSEMGMNLSGGQRQRISIAKALVNKPKVLILDEATSSLDAINESKVSNYFKSMGCTQIVIAHRLSTIINSDIIYVMSNGEVIETGTHDELMQIKGEYYSLYKVQEKEELSNDLVV